jgi:hypothetical protein
MNAVPAPATIFAGPSAQERQNAPIPEMHSWPKRAIRVFLTPQRISHLQMDNGHVGYDQSPYTKLH